MGKVASMQKCFQVAVLSFFFVAPTCGDAQHFDLSYQNKVYSVLDGLEANHLQYKDIAPQVPDRIVLLLAEKLDWRGRYLTKPDLAAIGQWCLAHPYTDWDRSLPLLDSLMSLYQRKLMIVQSYLEGLDSCSFHDQDSIELQPFDSPDIYSTSREAWLARWDQSLKYDVLMSHHQDSAIRALPRDSIEQVLFKSWQKEIENDLCEIETQLSNKEELKQYIFTAYVQAIAQSFDPHTDYFTAQVNDLFTQSLSTELRSPGFLVSSYGEKYYVAAIVPTSEAALEADLHEGDELLAFIHEGVEENLACLSQEVIYEYLYGESGDSLHVELKCSKDQTIHRMGFVKKDYDNVANKTEVYLLESQTSKVGYIALPSFYTNTPDGGGTSMASDLFLWILELKKKQPQGLIIDLRDNGGGSIYEAIGLGGYFIEKGALLQGKGRGKKVFGFADESPGQLFDGKVMFIVNENSASASEMLASALQFYPNVLVVGGQSYGKSTGQNIFALYDGIDNFGFLKVTNLGIYDLRGHSFQQKGVQPDVRIPTGYSSLLISEQKSNYPLELGSVRKKRMPRKGRKEPVEALQQLSATRIQSNQVLLSLDTFATYFTEKVSHPVTLSLSYEAFDWPLEFLESAADSSGYMTLQPVLLDGTGGISKQDSVYMEYLQYDPVVNESLRIFDDWLRLSGGERF